MLYKIASGSDKNSELKTVASSSATRVRWDQFEAQMTRLIKMEATSMAGSRFNRQHFISGVQKFLDASPFFKMVSLREGEMTPAQQKRFEINIDLLEFELTDNFIKQLQQEDIFKGKNLEEIRAVIRGKLETLLREISKEFRDVQSVRIDAASGLFNAQHFDDWLWHQNRELQSSPGDKLNFFLINMDSFASVNDYFSHGTGDAVLKNMGEVLTELRHLLHSRLGIAYENVGVHRHIGPNFVLSIRTQDGQELDISKVLGLLKNKIEHHSYQVSWDWEKNRNVIFEMQEKSVVTMTREMMINSAPEFDIALVPRFQKSDEKKEKEILGIKINTGFIEYPGSKNAALLNLTAKELAQVVNQGLVYINRLKKEKPEEQLNLNFMQQEYAEMINKFIDNQRTTLNEEQKWAIDFIKEWNALAERIGNKRSNVDIFSLNELIDRVALETPKSPSRQEIERELLKDFKKTAEESEVKLLSFYEVLKRTPLQKMLKQKYRPVYKMGSKYYFPVMDQKGHIHYIYEMSPKKAFKISDAVKLVKRILVHDYAFTQFIQKSKNDVLTGLPNRQAFESDFNEMLGKNALSLGAFDLNGFSGFTQTFGVMAGDIVIALMAEKLNEVAKLHGCKLYRYGGEEFTLIGPDSLSIEKAFLEMDNAMSSWLKEEGPWRYALSWNQLKENLSVVLNQMPEGLLAQMESQYRTEIAEQLGRSDFDPNKPYLVHLLRMSRYIPKKTLAASGLSFSAGFINISSSAGEHAQRYVDEADAQSHFAKNHFDAHRKQKSVIVVDGKVVE